MLSTNTATILLLELQSYRLKVQDFPVVRL